MQTGTSTLVATKTEVTNISPFDIELESLENPENYPLIYR